MNQKSKPKVTHVLVHESHFLANLLAFKKLLGMPMSIAKPLSKSSPEQQVALNPYYELPEDCLPIDKLKAALDEYGIEITVINQ